MDKSYYQFQPVEREVYRVVSLTVKGWLLGMVSLSENDESEDFLSPIFTPKTKTKT